ncbi:hypothetical protein [Luteolibacter marinus]|uniref:hypothetical protein n=1 Tax=Luteolibacter marinus TaxID=2776705 RepID=UPI001868A9D5|nr:hypothetical protein [Luteolibacter marinus]
MIFHRVIPLFLSALSPLTAAEFPMVPASDRVLSVPEVRNFWIRSLKTQPLPPKPTRLYPEKEAARQRMIQDRRILIEEVRSGRHDIAAKLVALSHNVEAWNRLRDDKKAEETERRLYRLREHVAKLATLEAQREAAIKVGESAERMATLSDEIQRLKAMLAAVEPSG